MAGGLDPKRIFALFLFVIGLLLVFLGLGFQLTFVICAPGALTCVRSYFLDFLAIIVGAIATVAGTIKLRRRP